MCLGLHPSCLPSIHVSFEPSGMVATLPAMHGSLLILSPTSIWPGQCPDTWVPFQPSPQMMPPAGRGAVLAASRAHGSHGQPSVPDTMPTFPFVLLASYFCLESSFPSESRSLGKLIAAKVPELSIFKSCLGSSLVRLPNGLSSQWNLFCESKVAGGLSRGISIGVWYTTSAHWLMETPPTMSLLSFWVKVSLLLTHPCQMQSSATRMASSIFTLALGTDSQILEKGSGKNWNRSRPITAHRKKAKASPFGATALGKLYHSVRGF